MSDYYHVTATDDGIYRFNSLENVFFELLVGTERALLIDTGYGFGDVKKAVRSITDKPLVVVNTHGHVDHTCGNYQFDEIWISDMDVDLLKRHNTPAFREKSIKLAEHTVDWATGQELYGLPDDFDREQYIAGGYGKALCPLEEGMVFDLGGKTIRTIATPGHTKGSMSFFYEEKGWLYAGDAVNCFLWLFDGDATDRNTYITTLEKLIVLKPAAIIGGHAPAPFSFRDIFMFKRAAEEADYEKGIPFQTPIMEDCTDVRVCILDGKTMADIGKPGFYAILLDSSRA